MNVRLRTALQSIVPLDVVTIVYRTCKLTTLVGLQLQNNVLRSSLLEWCGFFGTLLPASPRQLLLFLPYPQVRMLFKGRFLFVCYVFFWDRPLGKWHSERAFSSSFLFWQRDAALMEQRSHFLKTVFVSFSAEVASLVSVKTFNLEKSICSAVYSHPRSSLPASQTFSVLC